ncbi:6-hydroxymethylpterin diphosphokinase MptE-like protein [Shewanella sp. BJSY2023SW005]|uniref:6-hydroxymethylpterin diphosphokinase MptE-like protein n=1 Tax=Shewanella sp. BJSY2023SW005 TaxID=3392043 RepID=UPI0039B431F2
MQSTPSAMLNTFAVSRFNETYLPAINRQMFEQLNSASQYRNKFANLLSAEDTLYIFTGMDSGLLANYVLSMEMPAGSRFIFVELPEILTLLNIDLPESLEGKLWVITEAELPNILKQAGNDICIAKGQYRHYHSQAAAAETLPEYSLLKSAIAQALEHEYFNQGVNYNQKEFVQRQLENICDNHSPAKVLRGQFEGETAIIVAGGPSMDQQLDWLKANQSKMTILAVSRIAAKLISHGIKPDIVVTVDPQAFSFDVSKEMMPYYRDFLLVHSYHAHPWIVAQWAGETLYLGDRFPWQTQHSNIITQGPTVTNSSLLLAIEMGFRRILFIGMDLCYSRQGVSHAAGSQEAKLGPSLGHICEWVETYSGYLAETPIQLLHAKQAIEDEVAAHPQLEYINLAEDAAKIKGIGFSASEEIKLPQDKKPLSELLSSQQLKQADKSTDLSLCFRQLQQAQQKLTRIETITHKAFKACQVEINSPNPSKKLLKQLQTTEAQLNKDFSDMGQLIKFYGYREFSAFLTARSSDEWTQAQMQQMNLDYYQAYCVIARHLRDLVGNALTRVKSRQEELNPDARLESLAKQWQQDNTPGRVRIWQKNHPLLPQEKKLADELEKSFRRMLTESRQAYHQVLNDGNTQERVFDKIMLFKSQRHQHGLQQMVNNLEFVLPEKPELKRLYWLAKANLEVLKQAPEQALHALQQIDQQQITETELRMISVLALQLNMLPLAETTLAEISQLNDSFLPQYAHVLRLAGKGQLALDIYLDYLGKYPQDQQVWLKLALFMRAVQQNEAAVTAFRKVLELDPDNLGAKQGLSELQTSQ